MDLMGRLDAEHHARKRRNGAEAALGVAPARTTGEGPDDSVGLRADGVIDLTNRRRRASDLRPGGGGMPRVTVVVPTLNEERNLRHVLPRIPTWVDEVLLVDGRSTDGTIAEAQRLLPHVRIITELEPGKGRALFAGMRAATGDIVVAIDADGSMDPADLPRYVYSLLAGADFVKGSRFVHGAATDDMELLRRAGNRALTEIVRRVYGGHYSDLCYGYFAFWKDVLPYLEGHAPGFEVETHVSVRALAAGLQVVEVPTFEAERIHGASNLNTFRDGARVLWKIFAERKAFARSTLELPRPTRTPLEPGVLLGDFVPLEPVVRPSLSVAICAHDLGRWPMLVRAIDSLRHQTVAPDEVILVVDHNDALLTRARTELAGVRVLANRQQRGLSGARNTAIEEAGHDVVAFLDDDAWAADDWAERLLAAYDDPDVAAVGGAVEPHWAAGRPSWFPEEFDWVVGCTYRGLPSVRSQVRNVIGANMSFRRAVLVEAGGFDELLGRVGSDGAGCEETELCIRVRQADPTAQVVFEPAARVRHEVPASRGTWSYFVQRCRAEGRSKARVSRLVGASDGLASERSYVLRTLPSGGVRGLSRLVDLDVSGIAQAASLVAGLGLVGSSYVGAARKLGARSKR
jgi:glycosyltransferase involved in cell wall biosynthesis